MTYIDFTCKVGLFRGTVNSYQEREILLNLLDRKKDVIFWTVFQGSCDLVLKNNFISTSFGIRTFSFPTKVIIQCLRLNSVYLFLY